jgi:aminopeptidase N
MRAVWEIVVGAFAQIDRSARGLPVRAAFQAYARATLRGAFDRLGWDGPDDDDNALLRVQLIRALGELGDGDVLAEAQRRFRAFLGDPAALRPSLRAPVIHLVGLYADRETYDALLALSRERSGAERARYHLAAASARDPALAAETLARTLTDAVPRDLVARVIGTVAQTGEQPELALTFVLRNLDALAAKRGSAFRPGFIPDLMTAFSDPARADELDTLAPVQATAAGRAAAARARETILNNAEFRAKVLPAIEEWLKQRSPRGD